MEKTKGLWSRDTSRKLAVKYGKLKDTGDIIDLDMANKDTANIKQYYKTTIEI